MDIEFHHSLTAGSIAASEEEASRKAKIVFALRAMAIGVLLGAIIGAFGYFRNLSSENALANKLVKADACQNFSTASSGFCFNSAVTVSIIASNPISEFSGSAETITISAAKSQIGIFANAELHVRLNGLSGANPAGGRPLDKTMASHVSGTLSLSYSDLTHTLQSGSSQAASIFYAGNNEIGTSNQISYQGKQIPLVVISKITLKNNQLYLTPETVNALGRTAPASSVFSSVAPVPVNIPSIPKGLKYQSLSTTKASLIFHLEGTNIPIGELFSSH